MKYLWEPKDITVGRFYTKADAMEGKMDTGYAISTLHMIGYHAQSIKNEGNMCTISIADGMVGKPETASEIAADLNKYEYIPAHHDHVVEVFAARRSRNEGR